MKRVGNLYDKMSTIQNITWTYNRQVRKNTKNKHKIYKFDNFYTINICRIHKLLKTHYDCGRYNIFIIRENKYRIIMSQQIVDKVINHLVGNELIRILDKCLIDGNIATRKDKGTHYGIKLVKKYLNDLKKENKTIYVLKFDISKYFYNIDHHILNQDYINYHIQRIVFEEIDSVMVSNMHKKEKQRRINELKKIPIYEKDKGLPIGNLTSQILAVFYLNELDHYVWEKLNVKYIRYMDDGILLSTDKEYLKECLKVIKQFMDKYNLKLNNKTHISNVNKNGLDFLGFRFYVINNKVVMKLRTTVKRRLKRKMRRIRHNKFSEKKTESILASYRGHLKWGNCYNLSKRNGL